MSKPIVFLNGKVFTPNNIRFFVHKLELARGADVQWMECGDCVIYNPVEIEKPLVALSSGYKTTIKGGE